MCGVAPRSRLPDGVRGITRAILVTDEAVEAWGAEPLLAIRAFKPYFTQTGSIDVVTLGSVLTLTPLVTPRTEAAHGTVVLTPEGQIAPSFELMVEKSQVHYDKVEPRMATWNFNLSKVNAKLFFSKVVSLSFSVLLHAQLAQTHSHLIFNC